MKIAIGCDHAGYELKARIVRELRDMGHVVTDYGTNGPESVDYPDFAHLVAKDVLSSSVDKGVLICGSANGMAMTANKYDGIRCGLCWKPEIAELVRQHNDANIVAIPARFVDLDEGWNIARTFLETAFEGGRHERRVAKISCS